MEVTCGANTFSSLPSQLTPEPPEIRPMAAEVQVVLHHGTILPCDAHGLPRPSITWQREGVPVAAGMGTAKTGSTSVPQYLSTAVLREGSNSLVCVFEGHRLAVLSNGSLKFSRVTLGDAGTYQCMAKNEAGVAVGRTKLVLQGKARGPRQRSFLS